MQAGRFADLHIVGAPSTRAVTLQSRRGRKGNQDGLDDAAEAVTRTSIKLPVRKLRDQLAALNINRGTAWIAKVRARLRVGDGIQPDNGPEILSARRGWQMPEHGVKRPIYPIMVVLVTLSIIEATMTVLYPRLQELWEKIPILSLLVLIPVSVIATFLYLWLRRPGHLYPPSEF